MKVNTKDFGILDAIPVVSKEGACPSEWWEVEYRDTKGDVVGYWAYGRWEPSLPYRGDE